ncbi:MAG: signal peptidase I [Candidatus Woesearchaeota archaeon]
MFKGVVIAVLFFILGFSLHAVPLPAETRLATTDAEVESTQRIPFESIKVYADRVEIGYAGLNYATVNSNSMAPIITDKSVVFEKVPESPDEIKVGDVISFYEPSENAIVLHAVIEVLDANEGTFYKTKGLANPEADPWLVPYDNVKGIMVGTVR